MKLLYTLIIIIFWGCVTAPPISPDEKKVRIIKDNLDLDKNIIYDRCLEWIAKNYVDSKEVIRVQDKESGIIVGRGITEIKELGPLKIGFANVQYTLTINVKEDRFRITFDDFLMFFPQISLTSPIPFYGNNEGREQLQKTKNNCITVADELEKFVKKYNSETDW